LWPWVAKWHLAPRRSEDISKLRGRSGKPEHRFVGLKVVDFLDLNQFARLLQPQPGAFDHLKGWGDTVRHFMRVPSHPSAAMMEELVKLSNKLLVTVRSVKYRGLTHFLTGNES
jgi:hypothetical protein